MQEIGLPQVFGAIEESFVKSDLKRVEALLWPAIEQYPDISQLWFYAGCVFFKTGRSAPAAKMFERAIDLDDAAHVYSNLGACYRRMNLHEDGRRVLQACLDRDPNNAPALVNMGSMFVNEGCPHLGIPYLERAVELGKCNPKNAERGATWNLGLLYLECGRFAEGFDCYRQGVTHERLVRNYGGPKTGMEEPKLLDPEDPREGKTLIVWGEQGIGDELMFGTCLQEAQAQFGEVIFECHPRLEKLHKKAHPGMRIFPTRKEEYIGWPISEKVKADYKCPIGDLASLYRRDLKSFTNAAVGLYEANPAEVESYRAQLKDLAGERPVIGLATCGGVIQTARTYRTLKIADIDALFTQTKALFVSLDYDDMLGFASFVSEKYGADRYRWFPSIVQHWDYDHTAALVAACDMTVTVCQSVAHLAAGLGKPTRVLTPRRVAWREAAPPGLDPEVWYWWPDPAIRMCRQVTDDSWQEPIARVITDIRSLE